MNRRHTLFILCLTLITFVAGCGDEERSRAAPAEQRAERDVVLPKVEEGSPEDDSNEHVPFQKKPAPSPGGGQVSVQPMGANGPLVEIDLNQDNPIAAGFGQGVNIGPMGLHGVGRGGGGEGYSYGGLGVAGRGMASGASGSRRRVVRGRAAAARRRRVVRVAGMSAVRRGAVKPALKRSGVEGYKDYGINGFVNPRRDRESTFSIDVDTGSYTIARRKLQEGGLPPRSSVRVEEFVNFFKYESYPQPEGREPFAVAFEAAPSPTDRERVLLRVGVQGRDVDEAERKPVHLVFLVDTSGSMSSPDKIDLVRQSLHMLVNQLKEGDTVALATYAGHVAELLEPTGVTHRAAIHDAIERLSTGGGTAMSDGMETAYKLAYKTLKPDHVNRVIVLSDGDANIGASSHEDILKRIGHYTLEGVTLSTIGFGMGNYKDTLMEQLANKGNGNYYYIDSFKQARRVFVEQLSGTLQVIAKDVKIQVEFNPAQVAGYRLIGYENRDIADKDFRNDAVDAGEIGAGHRVIALYELKLRPGVAMDSFSPATVRLRHKSPQGARAKEQAHEFNADLLKPSFAEASRDFRLAISVANFAEKLRHSPFVEELAWSDLIAQTRLVLGDAPNEDEAELLSLMKSAAERAPVAAR